MRAANVPPRRHLAPERLAARRGPDRVEAVRQMRHGAVVAAAARRLRVDDAEELFGTEAQEVHAQQRRVGPVERRVPERVEDLERLAAVEVRHPHASEAVRDGEDLRGHRSAYGAAETTPRRRRDPLSQRSARDAAAAPRRRNRSSRRSAPPRPPRGVTATPYLSPAPPPNAAADARGGLAALAALRPPRREREAIRDVLGPLHGAEAVHDFQLFLQERHVEELLVRIDGLGPRGPAVVALDVERAAARRGRAANRGGAPARRARPGRRRGAEPEELGHCLPHRSAAWCRERAALHAVQQRVHSSRSTCACALLSLRRAELWRGPNVVDTRKFVPRIASGTSR